MWMKAKISLTEQILASTQNSEKHRDLKVPSLAILITVVRELSILFVDANLHLLLFISKPI